MKVHDNTPNGADTAAMDADELVMFVGILTDRLKVHEEAADTIRAARTRAFRDGRTRVPPVIQKRLAAAAQMTEGAVIAALKPNKAKVATRRPE